MHRSCPRQVIIEDLISAGFVGLVEAHQRYDTSRSLQFKTFAEHRIRGAMLDYLRKLDPLPREVRRFQKARSEALLRLSAPNGSHPSEEAVAGEMGVAVVKYRKFALIAEASTLVSTDLPRFDCSAAR